MADAGQVAKAEAFRALHDGPEPLVLVNASDASIARIVVEAGYPAVATSSAGIAWLMGYADGENIPRDEMLWMVRRIAERVDVPVTADMEAGYGVEPEAVADTVRATIGTGAIGLNIEDGTVRTPGPLLDYDLAVAPDRGGAPGRGRNSGTRRHQRALRRVSARRQGPGCAPGSDPPLQRLSRGRRGLACSSPSRAMPRPSEPSSKESMGR